MSEKPTYEEFLKKIEDAELPKGRSKDDLWAAIDAKVSEKKEVKVRKLNPTIYWAVASVLLMAALGYLLYPSSEIILEESALAETKLINLPDGSYVRLNAESSISYSEHWDRTLSLKGEAFFQVAEGETFTVSTATGNVSVLGTSFNVNSRNEELSVWCKTGKVEVEIPNKNFKEVILPGQAIIFENDSVKKALRRVELIATWQSGEFYFENADLDDVLDEMGRQFKVDIRLNSPNRKFTGYFKNKDLTVALESVCLPLGLEFAQAKDGSIVIQ